MRKSVVIRMTFAACLIGVTVGRVEAQCGGTPCVDSGDIVDGQIKTADLADGAVKTTKLGANAVAGAKVANNSLSEQDFSVANRLVVAKSGGDFTTIGAALASITPTATNSYVIDVMPGTYIENVVLKSFVHLRGARPEGVTIQAANPSGNTIHGLDLQGVRISGLTITGATGSGACGLFLDGGMDATGPGLSGTVTGNVTRGNNRGLCISGVEASPLVTENVVINNTNQGVAFGFSATPTILRNRMSGNGADIYIYPDAGIGHISFNVYDTLTDFTSGTAVGQFNVSSSGMAHPAL